MDMIVLNAKIRDAFDIDDSQIHNNSILADGWMVRVYSESRTPQSSGAG